MLRNVSIYQSRNTISDSINIDTAQHTSMAMRRLREHFQKHVLRIGSMNRVAKVHINAMQLG